MKQTEKTGLIEKNLFGLYKKMAPLDSFNLFHDNAYSIITSDQVEWPNFIFDFHANHEDLELIAKNIAHKVDQDEYPPFIIQKYDDSFIKIAGKLKQNGFLHVMRWPGMFLDIKESVNLSGPRLEIIVRSIENIRELQMWVEIVNQNLFLTKGLDADILSGLTEDESLQFILAFYDGKPAGTLLYNIDNKCMGIYAVSTLKQYRGKGCMRALMNYAITKARDINLESVVLEANNESVNAYLKIGFEIQCNFDIYWKKKN